MATSTNSTLLKSQQQYHVIIETYDQLKVIATYDTQECTFLFALELHKAFFKTRSDKIMTNNISFDQNQPCQWKLKQLHQAIPNQPCEWTLNQLHQTMHNFVANGNLKDIWVEYFSFIEVDLAKYKMKNFNPNNEVKVDDIKSKHVQSSWQFDLTKTCCGLTTKLFIRTWSARYPKQIIVRDIEKTNEVFAKFKLKDHL